MWPAGNKGQAAFAVQILDTRAGVIFSHLLLPVLYIRSEQADKIPGKGTYWRL